MEAGRERGGCAVLLQQGLGHFTISLSWHSDAAELHVNLACPAPAKSKIANLSLSRRRRAASHAAGRAAAVGLQRFFCAAKARTDCTPPGHGQRGKERTWEPRRLAEITRRPCGT